MKESDSESVITIDDSDSDSVELVEEYIRIDSDYEIPGSDTDSVSSNATTVDIEQYLRDQHRETIEWQKREPFSLFHQSLKNICQNNSRTKIIQNNTEIFNNFYITKLNDHLFSLTGNRHYRKIGFKEFVEFGVSRSETLSCFCEYNSYCRFHDDPEPELCNIRAFRIAHAI